MKTENFLEKNARDLISFGSPVFFLLALARIAITENYSYLGKVAIAGILFFLLIYFLKGNIYSGLGLIILVFLNMHYNDLRFMIFASLVYVLAMASLVYLKEDKIKILKGIFFGLLSIGVSYYIMNAVFG